jgi:proteasome assembly chaperone (PAC2) family protein
MGKSKKRILAKGAHQQLTKISRDEAISNVIKSSDDLEIENIITLFGLTAEELLEAGMGYEKVKSFEGLF